MKAVILSDSGSLWLVWGDVALTLGRKTSTGEARIVRRILQVCMTREAAERWVAGNGG